ncbi:hypothetical protein B0T22DRAFT_493613 [Podospora appendiculata]|uniref:Uncharacterized protein n=1 Tax=Podospora appendiculata TaxID=314037 RepID=A0AAE1C9G0_9PEZI|nr:hypothetical protein B0T22DRAFT_493613 [Podospora appendiculata]
MKIVVWWIRSLECSLHPKIGRCCARDVLEISRAAPLAIDYVFLIYFNLISCACMTVASKSWTRCLKYSQYMVQKRTRAPRPQPSGSIPSERYNKEQMWCGIGSASRRGGFLRSPKANERLGQPGGLVQSVQRACVYCIPQVY